MNISRILGCGLLAAVMLAPAIVQAEEHGDKSLAARVQRLEDQEEIRMLLVDYGRSLDARDFVKYSSLFAKDGEWSGGFGTAKVHGDTGAVWSRWAFIVTTKENTPSIMYGGHYDDLVVREEGHWKFKKRAASNDIPYLANPPASK
jgi:hypothetical protein